VLILALSLIMCDTCWLRPSCEELAALVVRRAKRIDQLEAEVAELRRRLGQIPGIRQAAVVGFTVRQARADVVAL
jgi:hypothetical protein